MNTMKAIRVEKVTLNVGAGRDAARLEKAIQVLKDISGIEPQKTLTQKRVATWGLRPGLPVGCRITLRGKDAVEVLKKVVVARENVLEKRHFDNQGNISFAVLEHIDIPGIKYDPKIGVIGLQVSVTLERPGFRVKRRSIKTGSIGKKHRIVKDEAIQFMKDKFNVMMKGEAQAA